MSSSSDQTTAPAAASPLEKPEAPWVCTLWTIAGLLGVLFLVGFYSPLMCYSPHVLHGTFCMRPPTANCTWREPDFTHWPGDKDGGMLSFIPGFIFFACCTYVFEPSKCYPRLHRCIREWLLVLAWACFIYSLPAYNPSCEPFPGDVLWHASVCIPLSSTTGDVPYEPSETCRQECGFQPAGFVGSDTREHIKTVLYWLISMLVLGFWFEFERWIDQTVEWKKTVAAAAAAVEAETVPAGKDKEVA